MKIEGDPLNMQHATPGGGEVGVKESLVVRAGTKFSVRRCFETTDRKADSFIFVSMDVTTDVNGCCKRCG